MVGTGKSRLSLIALILATAVAAAALAGEPDAGHTHGVNVRGDHAMGFSHMKATHHFRLLPDGGMIEVTANDLADSVSREAIRAHLSHAAEMFASGDFSTPMRIHDRVPPGAADMQRLKDQIRYAYQPVDNGGRVRISTRNARALVAIHEFLRFQITDHKSGDPLEVVDAAR